MTRIENCIDATHTIVIGNEGVVDQQNRVFGDNSHQHNQANHRGHTDGKLCDEQRTKRTANR